MLDVNLKYKDIEISNIEKDNIEDVFYIMKSNKNEANIVFNPLTNGKDIEDAFMEYYLSECEFFIKITYKSCLIGVVKGHAEFKNPNEIWISYFLKNRYTLENKEWHYIIHKLEVYFFKQYGIDDFYIVIDNNNLDLINIFKKNGFFITRIYKKNEYDYINSSEVVLKKKTCINKI
ncbi:GNAT family N-acetyltransferase [Clostridium botulinum]|nr:GNAT family N-acetyltransferase [Clostridium botulinum]